MLRFLVCLLLFVACTSSHKRTAPYVIARSSGWTHVNLYGAEKRVLGFSDDLLYEVSQLENIPIQLMLTPETPSLSLLDDGEADAILSGLQPNDQNMQSYLFSNPYFLSGPVLLIQQSAPYTSLTDMNGKIIGYDRNYNWALLLTDTGNTIFRPYDDTNAAIEALINGNIDGVVADALIAYKSASGLYRGLIRAVGPPLLPLGIRLIVKKGKNEELVSEFNDGLQKLKESGLYDKMLRYWGLFDITKPHTIYTESPSTF